MKIFCVIPAYNEEKSIATVIDGVKNKADTVIVVDDGSTDRTSAIGETHGAVVLRHIINRDQGAALQTGNEYALSAGAEIIIHFDADGQFSADDIPIVISPLERGDCDIVFGSRFLSEKSNLPLIKKMFIFPLARLVNRIFFGVKLSDPQSGFRAMTSSAAKKIYIEQDGKAHCSEIMAKAFEYKLRVKEVPITVTYHDYGQRFSGGLKIVMDFLINSLIK